MYRIASTKGEKARGLLYFLAARCAGQRRPGGHESGSRKVRVYQSQGLTNSATSCHAVPSRSDSISLGNELGSLVSAISRRVRVARLCHNRMHVSLAHAALQCTRCRIDSVCFQSHESPNLRNSAARATSRVGGERRGLFLSAFLHTHAHTHSPYTVKCYLEDCSHRNCPPYSVALALAPSPVRRLFVSLSHQHQSGEHHSI